MYVQASKVSSSERIGDGTKKDEVSELKKQRRRSRQSNNRSDGMKGASITFSVPLKGEQE
jgi:hypothetical protein